MLDRYPSQGILSDSLNPQLLSFQLFYEPRAALLHDHELKVKGR